MAYSIACHPGVVALDVADPVQPGRDPCSRGAPRIDSTRLMCSSKKSMIGHVVLRSSSRTSSIAAVVNASGVTGPVHGLVEDGHDLARLLDRGDERDQRALEPQRPGTG